MFIKKIISDGLSQFSYLVGDDEIAIVIDPRLDCEIYMQMAGRLGCQISHVIETHTHEDFVSGAAALGELAGAKVIHSARTAHPLEYAFAADDGESFTTGTLTITVVTTPGHTSDSICVAVSEGSGPAVALFTGDTLLMGDTGRTDLDPLRLRGNAGGLFDSLQKLIIFGDEVPIYPGHGPEALCAQEIAPRENSTLGVERVSNPWLVITDRDIFIERKVSQAQPCPPWFSNIGFYNQKGVEMFGLALLRVMETEQFFVDYPDGEIVDVRSFEAFAGAHYPGALSLPIDRIGRFAGWLFDPGTPVLLVCDTMEQAQKAKIEFGRVGFDHIVGFVRGSVIEHVARGSYFATLPLVDVHTVRARVESQPEEWALLDVRGVGVSAPDLLPGAKGFPLTTWRKALLDLPTGIHYTLMCRTGGQAVTAASLMLQAGFGTVDVFLGSKRAWDQAGYHRS